MAGGDSSSGIDPDVGWPLWVTIGAPLLSVIAFILVQVGLYFLPQESGDDVLQELLDNRVNYQQVKGQQNAPDSPTKYYGSTQPVDSPHHSGGNTSSHMVSGNTPGITDETSLHIKQTKLGKRAVCLQKVDINPPKVYHYKKRYRKVPKHRDLYAVTKPAVVKRPDGMPITMATENRWQTAEQKNVTFSDNVGLIPDDIITVGDSPDSPSPGIVRRSPRDGATGIPLIPLDLSPTAGSNCRAFDPITSPSDPIEPITSPVANDDTKMTNHDARESRDKSRAPEYGLKPISSQFDTSKLRRSPILGGFMHGSPDSDRGRANSGANDEDSSHTPRSRRPLLTPGSSVESHVTKSGHDRKNIVGEKEEQDFESADLSSGGSEISGDSGDLNLHDNKKRFTVSAVIESDST